MFWIYVKTSLVKIPWIILFGVVFYMLLLYLEWQGCVKVKVRGEKRILIKSALSILCAFIFVLTLFGRTCGNYNVHYIPFSSYYWAVAEGNTEVLLQCIMNVLMYLGLGFLLPCCFEYFEKIKRVLMTTFLCSLCIELIQGLTRIGYAEVDDVLNNLGGALLGMLLYKLLIRLRR